MIGSQASHNGIQLIGNPNLDEVLWRYMSIEKFIDLLSSSELFFSSLSNYSHSDPFEGYWPKTYYRSAADYLDDKRINLKRQLNRRRNAVLDQQKELKKAGDKESAAEIKRKLQQGDQLIAFYEQRRKPLALAFANLLAKSRAVNCWHANSDESEAMWKLYSNNGQAVAIQTTVKSLIGSITPLGHKTMTFDSVKYMDFDSEPESKSYEELLQPVKRNSYAHENERRLQILEIYPENVLQLEELFSKDKVPTDVDLNEFSKKFQNNYRVKVNLPSLIDAIHISPFADELFCNAVQKIWELFSTQNESLRELPKPHASALLKPFNLGDIF